ncbi:MAG: hypothetical protein AB7N91_30380 [Candidatus Tectimicrobiota bacterium]
MNTTTIVRALQTSQLADHDLLTPEAQAEVRQTLTTLAQRGLLAYVVLLPPSEELTTWYKLWPLLKLREGSALLLLYNGRRWEARGWGLPSDLVSRELQKAEEALRAGIATGVVTALTALAMHAASRTMTDALPSTQAARTRRALASEGASHLRLWLGGGSVVLLGGLAWILLRRRRQQRQFHTFTEAREAAEAAFTQVMLADGGLDEQIRELQWQATTHKQYLDTLIASVQRGQRPADDAVLLGEMHQLVNQFAALHSAILRQQKKR